MASIVLQHNRYTTWLTERNRILRWFGASSKYYGCRLLLMLILRISLVQFNITISVLSTFTLLVKSVMAIMRVLYPFISIIIHGIEFGLYMFSIHGQTSPDTIDPQHINNGPPWFITKSCSVTALPQNIGYCKQAKASFYVSVVMAYVSLHNVLWPLLNMLTAQFSVRIYCCRFMPYSLRLRRRTMIKRLSSRKRAKPVRSHYGKWSLSLKPQRLLITICQ
jgi:hypothetical protein